MNFLKKCLSNINKVIGIVRILKNFETDKKLKSKK